MTKQKELYSSPKTEILVVRFEETIMSPKGYQAGGGGFYGGGDTNSNGDYE
jgi:hypothetical protein